MENLSFIMAIAVIIVGVLQICLFFKVWGMCNNVVKIRRAVTHDSISLWDIRRLVAQDDIDNAEQLILQGFFHKCKELEFIEATTLRFMEERRWLIAQYQAIGREVPEAIAKAQTLHDLKQIFNPTYKV